MGNCNIYPTGAISWTKLRSLAIYHMTIDENLIQNILSGSPLLETLTLESCEGVSRLDITSKSVKNLILSEDIWPHDICEINAPYIMSLTIKASKLELKEEEMLKRFLSSFSHVKELKLGYCCTKIFTRLKAKGFLFPSNVKYLHTPSVDEDNIKNISTPHGDEDED
ncbi:F-box protein-like protein [Tanacetum coccineum]